VFHFYIVIIRNHDILEKNVFNKKSCMIWRGTNNCQINFWKKLYENHRYFWNRI